MPQEFIYWLICLFIYTFWQFRSSILSSSDLSLYKLIHLHSYLFLANSLSHTKQTIPFQAWIKKLWWTLKNKKKKSEKYGHAPLKNSMYPGFRWISENFINLYRYCWQKHVYILCFNFSYINNFTFYWRKGEFLMFCFVFSINKTALFLCVHCGWTQTLPSVFTRPAVEQMTGWISG